jgi:IS30 family transposase
VGTRYVHLSEAEREVIERMGADGHSLRAIARRLGRHPSTISREVRAGVFSAAAVGTAYRPYRNPPLRSASTVPDPVYLGSWAQRSANERAIRSHQPTKMRSDRLVAYVIDGLRQGWTPELISGRAREVDHVGDREMSVSHETIYAWIYNPSQARRKLMDYLPRAHRRRRKHAGRRVKRSTIKGRTPISARPSEADDRSQFGHWEGDTIIGATATGVRTEVERQTRFIKARLVPGTGSQAAYDAQMMMFRRLPPLARRSTTCDNGSEHALHAKLNKSLAMVTYFARPYHSWERGTNENRNGMIRRYFPKRFDFNTIGQRDLDEVIAEINNRPMAILGYQTPAEAYRLQLQQLRSNNTQTITTVALQT